MTLFSTCLLTLAFKVCQYPPLKMELADSLWHWFHPHLSTTSCATHNLSKTQKLTIPFNHFEIIAWCVVWSQHQGSVSESDGHIEVSRNQHTIEEMPDSVLKFVTDLNLCQANVKTILKTNKQKREMSTALWEMGRQKAKYLWVSGMNEGTIEHATCVENLTALQEEEESGNSKDLPLQTSAKRMTTLPFSCQEQTTIPAVAKTMSSIQPGLFPSLSVERHLVKAYNSTMHPDKMSALSPTPNFF